MRFTSCSVFKVPDSHQQPSFRDWPLAPEDQRLHSTLQRSVSNRRFYHGRKKSPAHARLYLLIHALLLYYAVP